MMMTGIAKTASVLLFATLMVLGLIISSADAACVSPAGNPGDIGYSSIQNLMTYCNGSSWIGMGTSSSIGFGTLTPNDLCTATSGTNITCTTAGINLATQVTGVLPGANGGTGVNNGASTITLGGNLTTSGAFPLTLTTIGSTSVTLPTSGTLISTASTPALGDVLYYNGTAWTDLAHGTSGQYLQTQGAAAPQWATVSIGSSGFTGVLTVPQGGTGDTSLTANGLLLGNGTGNVGSVGPGAAGTVLIGSSGAPLFSNSPSVTNLTLSGVETVTFGTNYGTTGLQPDVAINTNSAVRYTGTGTATFYGIVAGTSGQILYLHNASTSALTLSNQSGSESIAANKIVTGTGSDLVMAAGSAVTLQYDGTTGVWRVIGGSGGSGGNGTTNYDAIWTSPTTLGTGLLYESGSNVGIGTTSPSDTLSVYTTTDGSAVHVIGDGTGTINVTSENYNSNSTAGGGYSGKYARGSLAVPAAVQAGDRLSFFLGAGYTGTGFSNAAGIEMHADAGTIGSTSLPSYISFATTPNASLTRAERMRIDENGNVGIGTTNPTGTLDVYEGNTIVRDDGFYAISKIETDSTSYSPFLIFHRGRGTIASPSYPLSGDYMGSIGFRDTEETSSGVGIASLATENHSASAAGASLIFATVANTTLPQVERMRIDQNGYVGIGTTAPQNLLHVYSAGNAYTEIQSPTSTTTSEDLYLGGDTGNAQIFHGNSAYAAGFGGANALNIYDSNGPIAFFANGTGTANMTINTSGNVGIGTTSPNQALDVSSGGIHFTANGPPSGPQGGYLSWNQLSTGAGETDIINSKGAGTGGFAFFNVPTGSTTLGSPSVYITGAGNVGIGTTAPRTALDTYTGTMSGAANDYIKGQFTMSGGGTVTWGGSGGYLSWSGRFIAIPMSQTTASSGWIDIVMPTTNIPAAQVFNGTARTVNSNGVILNSWEALYAVHTPGGSNTAVTYYIVQYLTGFNAPSNWLLVAAVNGDDNSVKLGNGQIIASGGTFSDSGNSGQYVSLQSATPGTQQSGNSNISGTAVVGNLQAVTATPAIVMEANGGGTDQKFWDIFEDSTGKTLNFRAVNDAYSASNDWLQVNRGSGYTISSVDFLQGNVGIGTTSPADQLDVYGAVTPSLHIGDANGYTLQLGIASTVTSYSNVAAVGDTVLRSNSNDVVIAARNATGNVIFSTGATDTAKMTILNNGLVGIGTTSPTQTLRIASTSVGTSTPSAVPAAFLASAGALGTTVGNDINIGGFGANASGNVSYLNAHLNRVTSAAGWTGTALGLSYDVDATVAAGGSLWFYNNGSGASIGIGTSMPVGTFETRSAANEDFYVSGTQALSGGVTLASINDGNTAPQPLQITASQFYLAGGNVGIGTTLPAAPVEVFTSRQGAPSLTSSANTTAEFASTISTALDIGNDSASPYDVWLQTKRYTNDGSTWPLALNPLGGNVGIGTTAPSYPLHVISSNTSASIYGNDTSTGAGVYGLSTGGHGVVGTTSAGGSVYYGGFFSSGSYNAGLARADGYSLVGTGELYNNGIIYQVGAGNNYFSGNVGIGMTAGEPLDVNGIIRSNSEIISTVGAGNYGGFRAIGGNYGFMVRNDGSSTYFLHTASGSQYSVWNSDRQLTLPDTSDNVYLSGNGGLVGIGTTVPTQALTVSGNIDAMGGNNGYLTEITNSTATAAHLVTLTTSSPVQATNANINTTDGVVGVAVATTAAGNMQVAVNGQATCAFDGATTAGDFVTISSTTAGDCHDAGVARPAGSQSIGRVFSTNSSAGTYPVALGLGGTSAGNIPAGTIAAFASTTCPTGWTVWTPSTGVFLRGYDPGNTYDPSGSTRTVGSTIEADMLGSHTHGVTDPGHSHTINDPGHVHNINSGTGYVNGPGPYGIPGNQGGATSAAATTGITINAAVTGISIQAAGGAETRPKNVAVLYCRYAGGAIVTSGVTAGGTANYVARWTNATTLATGVIIDNGSVVGIGTTATGSLFNVNGGMSIGSGYVSLAAPTNGAIIQGNVGIGTASPQQALDMGGGNVKMGYESVSNSFNTSGSVSCSAGKQVLGGGCSCLGSGGNYVRLSAPSGTTGWQCYCDAGTGDVAYAMCANIK